MHLRTVSLVGHSHAVSMWACPVATMRWARARAGTASSAASSARAGRYRRRPGEEVEGALDRRSQLGAGAGRRPAACASRRRARRGRAAALRRRRRRAPARPGRAGTAGGRRPWPARRATTAGTGGTSGWTPPPRRARRARPVGDRDGLAARVDALHGPALAVAHQPLALEPGGVEAEPEVDQRLDAAARPLGGHVAGEAEPRRAPRRPPPVADGERASARRATARPRRRAGGGRGGRAAAPARRARGGSAPRRARDRRASAHSAGSGGPARDARRWMPPSGGRQTLGAQLRPAHLAGVVAQRARRRTRSSAAACRRPGARRRRRSSSSTSTARRSASTMACTTLPRSSSGRPITAHERTAGCSCSAASTSAG